jgi:hypothetical protein
MIFGVGHSAIGDVAVGSVPVGVTSGSFATGTSGFAFPLIHADVFVGVISTNVGSTIAFTESAGDVGTALVGSRPYYAEVATGAFEGERLDVDVAATLAAGDGTLVVKLGAGSYSTLGALGADQLQGARIVVRPHVRLVDVQALMGVSLVGDVKHNKAEGVEVYEGTGYAFYYPRSSANTWAKKDFVGEYGELILPPDVSVKVRMLSGGRAWLHKGVVRTNDFRKNLVAGFQGFATGFPAAFSPLSLGAFVDPQTPATSWVGNVKPDFADGIQLSAKSPISFNWFFLDQTGQHWQQVAQKGDVTALAFAAPFEAMLLIRNNPDNGFVVLRPFDL